MMKCRWGGHCCIGCTITALLDWLHWNEESIFSKHSIVCVNAGFSPDINNIWALIWEKQGSLRSRDRHWQSIHSELQLLSSLFQRANQWLRCGWSASDSVDPLRPEYWQHSLMATSSPLPVDEGETQHRPQSWQLMYERDSKQPLPNKSFPIPMMHLLWDN